MLAQRGHVDTCDEPSTFEGTRVRPHHTSQTAPDSSLTSPLPLSSSPRHPQRLADVLMGPQMLQATQHIVGLVPSTPGHSHNSGKCCTRLVELHDSASSVMLALPSDASVHHETEARSSTSLLSRSLAYAVHRTMNLILASGRLASPRMWQHLDPLKIDCICTDGLIHLEHITSVVLTVLLSEGATNQDSTLPK